MNLGPPPKTENVVELLQWCEDAYEFLKNPAFHIMGLNPRTIPSFDDEGTMYYDSGSDSVYVRDSDSWESIQNNSIVVHDNAVVCYDGEVVAI